MLIPTHCLYTDGQVFTSKKESYIAVTNDKGKVIFFALIGFKTIRETEGVAILKALEYLQEHNILEGAIYTDSLDWANIANGISKLNGNPRNKDIYPLADRIISLKEQFATDITWKRRAYNRAGHFLGSVWRTKKELRPQLKTLVSCQIKPKLAS